MDSTAQTPSKAYSCPGKRAEQENQKNTQFVVETTTTDSNNTCGYLSSIRKFTNSKGENSLNVSPIMSNVGIQNTHQKRLIDQIQNATAQLGFSCRYIGKDMFDDKSYQEDDTTANLINRCVIGSNQVYEFPRGWVQYEKRNEILYYFLNYEFMMKNKILPFHYCGMCETFEERIKNTIVKVLRSSGKIQPAIYKHNEGIIINSNNQGLIKLEFNDSDEPLEYTIGCNKDGHEYTVPPLTTIDKHTSIHTHLEVNPSIKFNIRFENPLTKCSDIYDKYIRGNTELEQEYAEVNQYYQKKLTEYVEKTIRPIFADIDEDRYNIEMYTL
jgi:hypothetical protein